jgi:hypothetical protein
MIYVFERHRPVLKAWTGRRLRRLQQSTQQHADVAPTLRYLGSRIVIGDDAGYCRFEAPPPPGAVTVANRSVGLPVDRIVAAVALKPTTGAPQ